MSRVGARREREGTIPRATAVPRLAKPARHAGYVPGAHRSIGGCRRSGEAASLRCAGQASPQRRRRGGPYLVCRAGFRRPRQAADAVDVALPDVAAQTGAELERPLDVQATAERQPAERRARERLRRDVGHEPRPRAAHDGQAGAVDRDALAEGKPRERPRRGDRETRPGTARLAPLEAARRLDDAGEHALDDRLRAVEEAPEPRLALARRQRFELAAVEPDAPARRTLVDGHVLIRDGREGLGATRTAEAVRRLLVAAETRQELAIALGEEAVLVRLLLLMELVAEPVFLIRHGSLPSTG